MPARWRRCGAARACCRPAWSRIEGGFARGDAVIIRGPTAPKSGAAWSPMTSRTRRKSAAARQPTFAVDPRLQRPRRDGSPRRSGRRPGIDQRSPWSADPQKREPRPLVAAGAQRRVIEGEGLGGFARRHTVNAWPLTGSSPRRDFFAAARSAGFGRDCLVLARPPERPAHAARSGLERSAGTSIRWPPGNTI